MAQRSILSIPVLPRLRGRCRSPRKRGEGGGGPSASFELEQAQPPALLHMALEQRALRVREDWPAGYRAADLEDLAIRRRISRPRRQSRAVRIAGLDEVDPVRAHQAR